MWSAKVFIYPQMGTGSEKAKNISIRASRVSCRRIARLHLIEVRFEARSDTD
jgi:hypothetical protein